MARRGRIAAVWIGGLGICLWAGCVCGCARYAAESNQLFNEEADSSAVTILDTHELSAVEKAIGQAAADHIPVRTPHPATYGVRWSDVPNAVVYALDEVEMAVVSKREHDWGWEFQILSVEDDPGTLLVKRTNDERVYEATATIGGLIVQTERAQVLLNEFDKQMLAFGRKKSLSE